MNSGSSLSPVNVPASLLWQRDWNEEWFLRLLLWTSVSSSFSLQARRRPASLSAVSPHPAVPQSARLHQWSALTGAKQRCFRTCRGAGEEEVGVEMGEKGQRPKTLSHTSSRFHRRWHPGHAAWNVKTGCQAATNEKSKSLKCICLFLNRGGRLFARGQAAQA